MIGRTPRFAALVATAALLGALTGCSKSSPSPETTVTVVVTPTPSTTASTPASTATASTTASASSTPTSSEPAHATKLPGDCDSLLPISTIAPALGHSITGKTAFVVGTAEKDIGRLAYLNCRYGLNGDGKAPMLEIGVSLYNTAAQASRRIPATTADYANHGASDATAAVGGQQAHILTGGVGQGYAAPTLVMAERQRTIAITLNDPKTKAADVQSVLTKIAAVVLEQTQPTR
jgi:hypothetical protein